MNCYTNCKSRYVSLLTVTIFLLSLSLRVIWTRRLKIKSKLSRLKLNAPFAHNWNKGFKLHHLRNTSIPDYDSSPFLCAITWRKNKGNGTIHFHILNCSSSSFVPGDDLLPRFLPVLRPLPLIISSGVRDLWSQRPGRRRLVIRNGQPPARNLWLPGSTHRKRAEGNVQDSISILIQNSAHTGDLLGPV